MTVLQYNTIPAEHQPLVAEAPNAGAIRVVECARYVLPQYQLTEWLQV